MGSGSKNEAPSKRTVIDEAAEYINKYQDLMGSQQSLPTAKSATKKKNLKVNRNLGVRGEHDNNVI